MCPEWLLRRGHQASLLLLMIPWSIVHQQLSVCRLQGLLHGRPWTCLDILRSMSPCLECMLWKDIELTVQLQGPVLHRTAWRHGTRIQPVHSHGMALPRVAGKLPLLLPRKALHVRQCYALIRRQAGIVDRPVVLGLGLPAAYLKWCARGFFQGLLGQIYT